MLIAVNRNAQINDNVGIVSSPKATAVLVDEHVACNSKKKKLSIQVTSPVLLGARFLHVGIENRQKQKANNGWNVCCCHEHSIARTEILLANMCISLQFYGRLFLLKCFDSMLCFGEQQFSDHNIKKILLTSVSGKDLPL